MKLSELFIGQQVTVQVAWGEREIEFLSTVVEKSDLRACVTPYYHNDSPLELNIETNSKVVCNVYCDSLENKKRRSWKNVELHTITKDGKVVYEITTSSYNSVSAYDDRREHDRVEVNKPGQVLDVKSGEYHDIDIFDVSDVGISFYADKTFNPTSNQMVIVFEDSIKDRKFKMRVDCAFVRTRNGEETNFWGCRTTGENKDFILYCFLLRIMSKAK